MLKVLGVDGDKFRIVDLDDLTDEELVSAEQLVLLLAKNEFEGCKHSRNGIEVWYDGVEPYEIPIEVWKPVSVFNVLLPSGKYKYEVSNLGNIRMNEYVDLRGVLHKSKQLNATRNKYGYRQITLRRSSIDYKTLLVHRLVGIEFVYNPNELPQINHLNECPGDDWAGNLSWCTHKENVNYGTGRQRATKKTMKVVRQYSFDGKLVAEYDSVTVAGIAVSGRHVANISLCCRRDESYRHCSGYVWRFKDDDELYMLSEDDRATLIQYCFVILLRQYTMAGKLVDTFTSAKDASLKLGYSDALIRHCARRESLSYKGFIWRFSNDDEFCQVPLALLPAKKMYKHRNCGINQYSLSGVLLNKFKSTYEASCASMLSSAHICSYCRDKSADLAHGFLWRYADDDELLEFDGNVPIAMLNKRAVRQYTIHYMFVAEYENCVDAARKVGCGKSGILQTCKRRSGHVTSGGFIWRLVSDDEFADWPENAKAIEEWRVRQNAET